jgi:hypothetical protein
MSKLWADSPREFLEYKALGLSAQSYYFLPHIQVKLKLYTPFEPDNWKKR